MMMTYNVTIYGSRKDSRNFNTYTGAWRHAQVLRAKGIQYIINQKKGK